MIALDSLRTFIAIAEQGSFARASEAVHLSPSAVSMQIKKLEEQLKTILFVRDSRNVALTSDGTKLLSKARQILNLSNETTALFAPSDLHATIMFGAPYDISERLLPAILKRLTTSHPSITVNVVVGTSESLLNRIRLGELDIAIINYMRSSDQPPGDFLAEERTVWVGARHGSSHRQNPVPLALFGKDCIWRTAALAQLHDEGRHYRTAYLSTHTMTQRAAVTADLAIAPLPASYITDDMAVLGKNEGFSELPSYEVRLVTGAVVTSAIGTIAKEIKAAFTT